MKKRTCGECAWANETVMTRFGRVWCEVYGTSQPKDHPECPARRAFRVLRDAYRELKEKMEDERYETLEMLELAED